LRNITTAVSATVTAVIIGLLIANVASAARAAEIAHGKEQQLAALQDSASANDLASQLEAYRTRYSQAYQQLAAAYQTLYNRDAEYRAALQRANATSAQLADADASLEAKLNDAYLALHDAQSLVASLRAGAPTAPALSPTPPVTARPGTTAAPAPTTAPARPTQTPRPSGTRRDD
jgi:ABC-type transporter Mla subunit MlaD